MLTHSLRNAFGTGLSTLSTAYASGEVLRGTRTLDARQYSVRAFFSFAYTELVGRRLIVANRSVVLGPQEGAYILCMSRHIIRDDRG